MSKALNDAVRDGILARNPAARVPLPRRVRPELQVWSREQLATFLPVAAEDRLHAAWLLALLCGLRRGELAGLRWRDVDLDQQLIRVATQRTTDAHWQVVEKEPKGTSRRTVDLGPMLVQALRRHRERAEAEAATVGAEGDPRRRRDRACLRPQRRRHSPEQ